MTHHKYELLIKIDLIYFVFRDVYFEIYIFEENINYYDKGDLPRLENVSIYTNIMNRFHCEDHFELS